MTMKSIVIMGATSGIGRAVAERFISRGYMVGVCGRRAQELERLRALAPERVHTAVIDITRPEADTQLLELFDRMGGVDTYFHISGSGKRNSALEPSAEIDTLRLNGEGFVRMVDCAYRYFRERGGGQIAAVTSIAGTKGLGAAPAYSATKRMQTIYLQSLAQLSHMNGVAISITDIRPGFIDTALLDTDSHRYPMLMNVSYAADRIVRAVIRRRRVRIIDWKVLFFLELAILIIMDRKVLMHIDYILLLTFVCFFIFSENMGKIETVRNLLTAPMTSHPVATSALVSQVISNVPAAILLSPFSSSFEGVLVGTDIGGLGTPIASLASLISLKFYYKRKGSRKGRYMAIFLLWNFVLLGILALVSLVF